MAQNQDNLNFIAALALYQHRRDNALGLTHLTGAQRGLIWYYNETLRNKLTKAFHYGIIQGARQRIKEIRKTIKKTTPIEVAERLYKEALVLEQQIEKSSEIINGR